MSSTCPTVPVLHGRWAEVWSAMGPAGLGALVVFGTGALGQYGNLAYLTGRHVGSKGSYLVLRRGEAPVLVARTEQEAMTLRADGVSTDVDIVPDGGTGRAGYLALVADLCGDHRAGLAGPMLPPAGDVLALQARLGPDLPVVDIVAEARRAQSAYDHACLRAEATAVERALEKVPAAVRSGATERDIAAAVECELVRGGSRVRIVHASAGPFRGQFPSDRLVRDGDVLTVFAESAGPTGHWVELGVVAHVGDVDRARAAMTTRLRSVLRSLDRQLLDGRSVAQVWAASSQPLGELGETTIGLGHGTGVDEQAWAVEAASSRRLTLGEAVALHPSVQLRSGPVVAAGVANTYIVGPRRAEPLSELPYSTLVLPRP